MESITTLKKDTVRLRYSLLSLCRASLVFQCYGQLLDDDAKLPVFWELLSFGSPAQHRSRHHPPPSLPIHLQTLLRKKSFLSRSRFLRLCDLKCAKTTAGISSFGFKSAGFSSVQEQQEDGEEPEPVIEGSYGRYMKKLLRVTNWASNKSQALRLLKEMNSQNIATTRAYTVVIRTAGRNGDTDTADALFKEMIQHDLPLDVFVFNTYMNAYARKGRTEEAFSIFGMMKEAGIEPNDLTYRMLMSAYGSAKDVARTLENFNIVQEQFPKDIRNYNLMIHAYASAVTPETEEAYYKECIKLMEEMKELNWKPSAFTNLHMMKFCSKTGRKKDALKYLETTLEECQMRPYMYDHFIRELGAMDLSDNELYDTLTNLFDNMAIRKFRIYSTTYECLIDMFESRRDLLKALDFFEHHEETGGRKKSFPLSGKIVCYKRMVARGMLDAKEAIRKIRFIFRESQTKKTELSMAAFHAWLEVAKQASDIDAAMECWENKMKERGIPYPEMITTMIEMFVEHNRVNDAVDVLLYMKRKKISLTERGAVVLAEALAREGDETSIAKLKEAIERSELESDAQVEAAMSKLEAAPHF